jgi:hypothetical protein
MAAFSPASASSTTASCSPDSQPRGGSSSATTGDETTYSPAGSLTLFDTQTYEPSGPDASSRFASSSEDSRAKEQAPPASAMGSSTPKPFCGAKWPESFASYDPDSSCWRTSQTSLLSTEATSGERFSGTWPRSGTTRNGIAYRQQPSAPLTAVTGSSPLLPTPNAMSGGQTKGNVVRMTGRSAYREDGTKVQISTEQAVVSLLPTPDASVANYAEDPQHWQARAAELKVKHGNGNGHGTPLAVQVRMLPTPAQADGDRTSETFGRGNPTLPGAVKLLPTPKTGEATNARSATVPRAEGSKFSPRETLSDVAYRWSGGRTVRPSTDGKPSSAALRLSPWFVEWMIGAPPGWSDPGCLLSATEFKSRWGL